MTEIAKLKRKRKFLLWGGWVSIILLPIAAPQSGSFPLWAITFGICAVIYARILKKKIEKIEEQNVKDALKREVDNLIAGLRAGTVNVVPEKAILTGGEIGIAAEMVSLHEIKSERVGSHGGVRIGAAYIGRNHSKSVENWEVVAHGELVLTTRRLIFVGDKRNIEWPLGKLTSIEILADGIRVAGTGKTKPVMLGVSNPVLWNSAASEMARDSAISRHIENTQSNTA